MRIRRESRNAGLAGIIAVTCLADVEKGGVSLVVSDSAERRNGGAGLAGIA